MAAYALCCASTDNECAVSRRIHQRVGESESEYGVEMRTNLVRRYRLYNRCSNGYLQMYLNQVNARGKNSSPLVELRVESDSYGSRIRIQTEKFGKYLCFNRRKRITSRYNGKHKRCVFVEKLSENHYTELESAWSEGLYLGFGTDGRFLNPKIYSKKRYCFQYIKTELVNFADEFHRPNFGPRVDARKLNITAESLNVTAARGDISPVKNPKPRRRHHGRRQPQRKLLPSNKTATIGRVEVT